MRKNVKHSFRFFYFILLVVVCSCTPEENNSKKEKISSAFVYGFRMEQPNDKNYYLGVFNELVEVLDIKDATKLGPNRRVWSYKEHPYVWNADSSMITKWHVDKLDLSLKESKSISVAEFGIAGDMGEPIFYSDSMAFFFALREGKIVEFNPEVMTITAVHDVEPIQFDGDEEGVWYDAWNKYVIHDKIIMPIGFIAGPNWTLPNGAMVAVFEPAKLKLTYHIDQRLQTCFYLSPRDGDTLYIVPGYNLDAEVHYSSMENHLPTQNLLRLNVDGSFDQNFELDLSAALDSPLAVYDIISVIDQKALVLWREGDEWPTDPQNRYDNFYEQVRYSVIDIRTKEVKPFTTLDQYAGLTALQVIDGYNCYMTILKDEPDMEILLRQNSLYDYTEVTRLKGGSVRMMKRLW
ncbi:MAG: hypothetical protein AAF632_01515 [Bacteroidota bacterium]